LFLCSGVVNASDTVVATSVSKMTIDLGFMRVLFPLPNRTPTARSLPAISAITCNVSEE
jgi:hypothetical protein